MFGKTRGLFTNKAVTLQSMTANMKESTTHFLNLRGTEYCVRSWGATDAKPLVMLHGWMDVSASYQFVVDQLQDDWHIIAPDWRGFGQSQWSSKVSGGTYWYPDYLADLEAILEHFVGREAVDLVGHSMGGNVGGLYAGLRPERIKTYISLEGFGMPPTTPDMAVSRYREWLDQMQKPSQLKTYTDFAELAARLQKNNPRLDAAKAEFLARHWGHEVDGQVQLRADPAHKHRFPVLYRAEEAMAVWSQITAPTLWVIGKQTTFRSFLISDDFAERQACIKQLEELEIDDAGHMLHHDQPALVAELIEGFIAKHNG